MDLPRRVYPTSNGSSDPLCFVFPCPPPPEPSPDPVRIHLSGSNHHLTNLLIVAFSLLAFSILIFAVIFLSLRRRRGRRGPLPPPPPPGDPLAADDSLPDPFDHHVWHIRTVGLDPDTIASIALLKYDPRDGLVDGTDCAVCLAEFRHGEDLRLLPKCSHAFHVSCIDTWLGSHVSCPLCRAPIFAAAPKPSDPVSDLVLEDSGTRIHLSDGDQTVENEGNDEELAVYPGSISGSGVSGEFQPVRRSVSMDAVAMGALLLSVEQEREKDGTFEEESGTKNKGRQGMMDSKGDLVRKGTVRMGRSLSSSGSWLTLPKRGRTPRNSTLPV